MKKVMLELEEISGVSEKYKILNENSEEMGNVKYRYNDADKCVFIESLYIKSAYRRQGYGTLIVKDIIKKFKGCWMIGDILYPIAFDFWSNFDKQLIGCDRYSADLWFEFVC